LQSLSQTNPCTKSGARRTTKEKKNTLHSVNMVEKVGEKRKKKQ
jgi:hypothetical protein